MADAISIESLGEAALQLQPDARIQLAHSLVESLSTLSETEFEELWLQEAERRDNELESGQGKAIPGEDIFAQIQNRHGK